MSNIRKGIMQLSYLIIGAVFGIGLSWSEMINPAKVLGFLDIFGAWDPSLLLVMFASLCIARIAYVFTRNMKKPVFAEQYCLPTKKQIDSSLVFGAILFGLGWGLVGLCPGPAVVSIVYLKIESFCFLISMLFAMSLVKIYRSRNQ